jgi:hypothetical protein
MYCMKETHGRRGWGQFAMQHGVRRDVRSVHGLHGIVIPLDYLAIQRKASEDALCARVGENLGVQFPIRVSGSMTAYRAGGRRCIGANLKFTRKQMLHAPVSLENHDEIDAFHADLESPASTADGEESRRAPSRRSAASGNAFAAFRADYEATFQHVWNNSNALCVFENFFRNALVWSGHYFVKDSSGMLKPVRSCFAWGVCPAKRSQGQYGT